MVDDDIRALTSLWSEQDKADLTAANAGLSAIRANGGSAKLEKPLQQIISNLMKQRKSSRDPGAFTH